MYSDQHPMYQCDWSQQTGRICCQVLSSLYYHPPVLEQENIFRVTFADKYVNYLLWKESCQWFQESQLWLWSSYEDDLNVQTSWDEMKQRLEVSAEWVVWWTPGVVHNGNIWSWTCCPDVLPEWIFGDNPPGWWSQWWLEDPGRCPRMDQWLSRHPDTPAAKLLDTID